MSKANKRKLAVVGVLLFFAGAEAVLNILRVSTATVRIVNQGDEPVLNLQLSCGDTKFAVERIAPEASVSVRVSGRGTQPLKLSYTQAGNALSGFEITDFSPRRLSRDRTVLVLEIRSNEFTRYAEPDETPTALGRIGRNVGALLGDESEPSP